MANYTITSDITTLGKRGATVTDEAMQDLNIPALVEGEHISPTEQSTITEESDK